MASQELGLTLPGSGDWGLVCLFAPLLLLPRVLAIAALRSTRTRITSGRMPTVPLRSQLWLSACATPLTVYALFAFGSYGDCLERVAWNSPLLGTLLMLAPAYVAELCRVIPATIAQVLGEQIDDRDPRPVDPQVLPSAQELRPIVRLRFGWPVLVLLPLLVFGGLMEMVSRSQTLHVFLLVTSPGVMASAVTFLIVSVVALPFVFRFAFGVDSRLPEPLGKRLREVAASLGFPPAGVLRLRTGGRALNAMMVGPLPFGRFLCITDGLLAALNPEALSGVVAHEVAHARLGHVRWFLVVALALACPVFSPWLLRQVADWPAPVQVGGSVIAGMLAFWLMRSLAHRFEHEADAGSVRALGAGPCSQALLEARRQAGPPDDNWRSRVLSMHPEDSQRWQHMRRYEIEPAYRERFEARGRRLRSIILAGAVVVLGMVAWTWQREWPIERALWRLHAGNVVGAAAGAAGVATVPESWQRTWKRFGEDLAAARELAPTAQDWRTARAAFANGWSRAEQVLLAEGPAAARPWFAMALNGTEAPSDLQRALYAFCYAAAEPDPERLQSLKEVVRRLGVPSALAPVFAD